jgi:hypothetical protein
LQTRRRWCRWCRRSFNCVSSNVNCCCVVICANFFRGSFLCASNFLCASSFLCANFFLRASNFFRRRFFNWLVRDFFWLYIAHQTFTLGTRTNAICLSIDNSRRWALYANAKFSAEVNDLGVGHSEFFGDLVNAFGFWQSV